MKNSETIINITYKITGEAAKTFLELKELLYLENNAELARSLMFEKMHEKIAAISIEPKRKPAARASK